MTKDRGSGGSGGSQGDVFTKGVGVPFDKTGNVRGDRGPEWALSFSITSLVKVREVEVGRADGLPEPLCPSSSVRR